MYPANQATYQLVSIFGGNFVSEQHGDATHRWLPSSDDRQLVVDFDKLLSSLRSALSLRRSAYGSDHGLRPSHIRRHLPNCGKPLLWHAPSRADEA